MKDFVTVQRTGTGVKGGIMASPRHYVVSPNFDQLLELETGCLAEHTLNGQR